MVWALEHTEAVLFHLQKRFPGLYRKALRLVSPVSGLSGPGARGPQSPVTVINLIARQTIEHGMLETLVVKQGLTSVKLPLRKSSSGFSFSTNPKRLFFARCK